MFTIPQPRDFSEPRDVSEPPSLSARAAKQQAIAKRGSADFSSVLPQVAYLGPEGTFSHAAALQVTGSVPVPYPTAPAVLAAVRNGQVESGVIAVENTVEGPVVAAVDGLLAAGDLAAVQEIVVPITFNAYTARRISADSPELSQAVAHPHGLAQVRGYIAGHGWQEIPADSNAAAIRDLAEHQVAFGADICGDLYGRYVLAAAVEDFPGALTRFLVLLRREAAVARLAELKRELGTEHGTPPWRSLVAVIPMETGPGVLARVTKQFGQRGINMSSLISRPLKAQTGKYAFILTMDAAPWEPRCRALLADLLSAGDAVKTLGVWLADTAHSSAGGVLTESLPPGSATGADDAATLGLALLW